MIMCLECKKSFSSLPYHLRRKHDLSSEQYREKFHYDGPLWTRTGPSKLKGRKLSDKHKASISAGLYKNPPRKGCHLTQSQKDNLSFKIKVSLSTLKKPKRKLA